MVLGRKKRAKQQAAELEKCKSTRKQKPEATSEKNSLTPHTDTTSPASETERKKETKIWLNIK